MPKKEQMHTVGERLKNIRIEKNLTITEVSQKTGISKGNLSSIENNKNKPSAQALVLLSELYGVTTDWILKGESQGLLNEPAVPYYIKNENKLLDFFDLILKLWEESDEDMKGWIIVQLKRAFPELADKLKNNYS